MALHISRANGVLSCTIRGDGTNDDTWFGDAVTACNAHTGPSRIVVAGTIELTSQHDFTGATSLIGETAGSQINFDVTGTSQYLTWNLSYAPENETPFLLTDVAAGDAIVNVSSGTPPAKGDWVVVWSHDQITGVSPHWDGTNGYGHGQHPETLHLVDEVFGNKVILNDPVPFAMTAAGLARGAVVDSMVQNVTIDNLILNWSGAGSPSSFATVFRICAIDGVTVTDRVTTTRDAPGAVWFDYCANIQCDIRLNGSTSTDGIYGIVCGPVNGAIMDPIVKGTRHGFTTTAGIIATEQDVAVDSVTPGSPGTVTVTGHGWSDGYHLTVEGTLGDLPNDTPLWIVNSGTDTIQLATSPGGTALDIAGSTSTGVIHRQERWGTPINVVCRGIWYSAPKWTSTSATVTRQVWDTHAEGYGIVVDGARFIHHSDQDGSGALQTQYVAQSRSIATVFRDCTFEGGNAGADIAVRLLARDCQVINCTFNGRNWYGVEVIKVSGTLSPLTIDSPDNCRIVNNTFDNTYAYPVRLSFGDDHVVSGNVFTDCGDTQGGSPFHSKSLIAILRGTGHKIYNNVMAKDTNDSALDMYQLTTSDVYVAGNVMTGYGSGVAGFGRVLSIVAWDDTANDIRVTTSHGWATNDQVQLIAGAGTLPAEFSEGTVYYVIKVDTDELQLEASIGGGAIDFSAGGSGGSVQNGTVDEFETAYAGLNWTDA